MRHHLGHCDTLLRWCPEGGLTDELGEEIAGPGKQSGVGQDEECHVDPLCHQLNQHQSSKLPAPPRPEKIVSLL